MNRLRWCAFAKFNMAAINQFRLVLLFVATLTSQSLAQDENCELITESELGNTTTHSQDGLIPTALKVTDSDGSFLLIRGYRVTCSVAGTAPDTYQYLSVVVSFSCGGLSCDSNVSPLIDEEGDFTMQFELRCTSSNEWTLGNDFTTSASAIITNPANGNLTTPHNRRCGLCLSNDERATRLFPSVVYNAESHCASCDSSCLSKGSGQCTDLGAGNCCPFYVYNNTESGFMCVDECPNGTLPDNNSLCLGRPCQKLVDPANGMVLYEQSGQVYFAATYICNDGYYLVGGDEVRMCHQSNGTWSGTEPTCNERCSDLNPFKNGQVTYSQDDIMNGTVATYKCNTVFTLIGNEMRTCLEDANWSGSEPECRVCGDLHPIENGTVTYSQNGTVSGTVVTYMDGTVATYICNATYTLIGNERRTCLENATWSGSVPECRVCGDLNSIENGMVTYTDQDDTMNGTVYVNGTYMNGTVATYECNTTFVLVGNETRTCLEDATWSGSDPSCVYSACDDLSPIENGTVTYSLDTTNGIVATYECKTIFTLIGNVRRTCLDNVTWSGSDPSCRVCGDLKSIENGSVTYTEQDDTVTVVGTYMYRTVATYKCNTTFTLIGNERRTCLEDATWSGSEPECIYSVCDGLSPIENGQITYSLDTLNRTVATYVCNNKAFELVGNENRTCLENVTWNGSDPTCDSISISDASSITVTTPATTGAPTESEGIIIFVIAGAVPAFVILVIIIVVVCIVLTLRLRKPKQKNRSLTFTMGALATPNHEEAKVNIHDETVTTENDQLSRSIPETFQPVDVNAAIDITDVAGASTHEQEVTSVPSPVEECTNTHHVEEVQEVTLKKVEPSDEEDERGLPKVVGEPVTVDKFGDYVATSHNNNSTGFRVKFQSLPSGEEGHSVAVAREPQNKRKNRFKNIVTYDDNRIILRPVKGQEDNDYINASYIDGYSHKRQFIASQGPLSRTINDFWCMVWQEQVQMIVMVTNTMEGNTKKCAQYWPESESCKYGPVKVTITEQLVLADCTIRSFHLQLSGERGGPKKVTQFHFTSWPDHGVPEYAGPFLTFYNRIKADYQPSRGPILIHCSAGVGRTGTVIATDIALEQAANEGIIDVSAAIGKMRQQRMKMVQTSEQYVFIHDAVLESLMCGDTQIPASNLKTAIHRLEEKGKTNISGFEAQFHVLEQVCPKPSEVLTVHAMRFPHRNRNLEFLPPDRWRVPLKAESPDYIHASFVNGYKLYKEYIIAQSPMRDTCREFWKMVCDRECGVIVMLSQLMEEEEEVCFQYWTNDGTQEFGNYLVTTTAESQCDGYMKRSFDIKDPNSKIHKVTQYQLGSWNSEGLCTNTRALMELIEEVVVAQRRSGNHPVIIHGRDTVSRCGVFCALLNTVKCCKADGTVDVFQMVKTVRIQKPGTVSTMEQYRFVFDMMVLFVDSFSIYANFK